MNRNFEVAKGFSRPKERSTGYTKYLRGLELGLQRFLCTVGPSVSVQLDGRFWEEKHVP